MAAKTAKIEYKGNVYAYDPTALKSYTVIKAVSNPNNPEKFFSAFERIFCGKDMEVAEMLGDSLEEMSNLIMAITKEVGGTGKN